MPYKNKADQQVYKKQYYKDHREGILVRKKQYYKDNRKKINAKHQQHYKDHLEEKKQYYKDHSEEIKQYRKDHPEVGLRSQKNQFKKLGLTNYQLRAWTKVIRKGKNCSYCDSDKDLHSHHIISKSKHPGLALNENNGIPLCVTCHSTHHSLNGATA